MKTVFSFTGIKACMQWQSLNSHIIEIQSLLDPSSDILVLLEEKRPHVSYSVILPDDALVYLNRIRNDVRRYLSLFDYITVPTFRMITETAGSDGYDFSNCVSEDETSDFYDAAFRYGMDQSNRKKFERMLALGETRRRHGDFDAADLLGRIRDEENRYAGNAQCMRDRDIQEQMIRKGQIDLFWNYLLTRSELFEYHCIFPDERHESNMILDKVIRFSRLNRIDRGYYCEAVYRMITDGDTQRAKRIAEEGLEAEFDDTDDDRRAVWKLHYYKMILADDSRDAALEADLINSYPLQIKGLIWNRDLNSGAVASGEAYYKCGEYRKAEDAVRTQYEMICRCMDEGQELIDLPMDLDEQFKVLLLKAEIRKITDPAGDGISVMYRRCADMIEYIRICKEKRGFMILTDITETDIRYVLKNAEMSQGIEDKFSSSLGMNIDSCRNITDMYRSEVTEIDI